MTRLGLALALLAAPASAATILEVSVAPHPTDATLEVRCVLTDAVISPLICTDRARDGSDETGGKGARDRALALPVLAPREPKAPEPRPMVCRRGWGLAWIIRDAICGPAGGAVAGGRGAGGGGGGGGGWGGPPGAPGAPGDVIVRPEEPRPPSPETPEPPVAVIPLPPAVWLMLAALAALVNVRRKA